MRYGYDVAQICLNGHVVNDSTVNFPDSSKKHCDKCGAPTITKCQHCNSEIQGYYHVDGVIGGPDYAAPGFCPNCGKPYPWTDARIKAAQELAQELEISENEKATLVQSIDDIVKDTPRTTLGATRFKKILAKTSKTVAEGFKDILVDIASETAKKIIWPEK